MDSDIYLVKSESALHEYLRFRPQSVRAIRCRDRRPLSFAVPSGVAVLTDPESETAITADVRHVPMDFDSCIRRLEGLGDKEHRMVLALDHVTDPRNLGAIVRSAAFFGVHEILVPRRRQVLFTQVVVDTAHGGFGVVDLVPVVNLARSLRTLKDLGFWVAAADMGGQRVRDLPQTYEKLVVVLGAEGSGISANIRKQCDFAVAVMPRGERHIESLNVSVACGILLDSLTP